MLILASLTVVAIVAVTLFGGSAPQLRPVPVRRRHRVR